MLFRTVIPAGTLTECDFHFTYKSAGHESCHDTHLSGGIYREEGRPPAKLEPPFPPHTPPRGSLGPYILASEAFVSKCFSFSSPSNVLLSPLLQLGSNLATQLNALQFCRTNADGYGVTVSF